MTLCVDTSGDWTNLALGSGEALLATMSTFSVHAHARTLLASIEHLLATQRMGLADVDVLATCLGPGSFTGLRVGVTTVKGLRFALEKPVVGVLATDVLRAALPEEKQLACAIDAKKGEVYFCLFRRARGKDALVVPHFAALPEDGVQRILSACRGPVLMVGSACRVHPDRLVAAGRGRVELCPSLAGDLPAEVLYRVCVAAASRGGKRSEAKIEPFYVRPPSISVPKPG